MQPESLLSYSQETATVPYSEQHESSPHLRSCSFKIRFNIILPSTASLQSCLFP